MRQKILSGLALFASLVALAVSLGAYMNSSKNDLPNEKAYRIQLIGVGFIVLICALNFVSALKSEPEAESEEVADAEEQEKAEDKKVADKKAKKPVRKSSKKPVKKSSKKKASKKPVKKHAKKRK